MDKIENELAAILARIEADQSATANKVRSKLASALRIIAESKQGEAKSAE